MRSILIEEGKTEKEKRSKKKEMIIIINIIYVRPELGGILYVWNMGARATGRGSVLICATRLATEKLITMLS